MYVFVACVRAWERERERESAFAYAFLWECFFMLCAGMCLCTNVCMYECVCVWERVRERGLCDVYVCVCVRERSVRWVCRSVCVCMCVWKREREVYAVCTCVCVRERSIQTVIHPQFILYSIAHVRNSIHTPLTLLRLNDCLLNLLMCLMHLDIKQRGQVERSL